MEILRKYNEATTILFPLIDRGTLDFESTPVSFVAADCQISKDEGAFANTGSTPTHEGNGIYSLALTATEMQAARIVITVIDSATKTWEDQAIIITTYGNASAQHAFDLDTATQNVNVASMDANTVTSSAIATNAIDSGAIAANAIGSSELATDAIGSAQLSAAAVDEIWDEVLEGTVTGRQFMRIMLAALAGKSAGGGTGSVTFRDNADAKNRISATLDANGNRTAMTLDGT